MIYIEIPYTSENDRIDKGLAKKEIEILKISGEAKEEMFRALYHRLPRFISFDDKDSLEIVQIKQTLSKIGAPYRQVEHIYT